MWLATYIRTYMVCMCALCAQGAHASFLLAGPGAVELWQPHLHQSAGERNDFMLNLCPETNIKFYINMYTLCKSWQPRCAVTARMAYLAVGGSSTLQVHFSRETAEFHLFIFLTLKCLCTAINVKDCHSQQHVYYTRLFFIL